MCEDSSVTEIRKAVRLPYYTTVFKVNEEEKIKGKWSLGLSKGEETFKV